MEEDDVQDDGVKREGRMMLRMTMLSQDLGPHFAPARKVDMHLDMSEESEELRVEIYRKSAADHTLRETA